ncbi:aldose 1-epimerase [Hungatella effluvii]|uniref:Aldose 1-epimerase n=1 Tax=Hungatella effluvii TaxID=1096246 RepID=A0A2V3YG19_9FIRM|nr:hypothetical protein [Hungatella effluvii]PXX52013.1 aldose 1-epimerase [Hungatella effluvii]
MMISRLNSIETECYIIDEYCLDNGMMSVHVITYGASLTGIYIPSGIADNKINVLLSSQDLRSYVKNPWYAGASLGPTTGRIKDGIINFGKNKWQVMQNEGQHNIHGGFSSLSYTNTAVGNMSVSDDWVEIVFTTMLNHRQDGFPGNRVINICYRLTKENRLLIRFNACSDQDTYLNLSNHAYFNLSGDFTTSVHNHYLTVYAKEYVANTTEHIPDSRQSVKGTPFDFREHHSFVDRIQQASDNVQIQVARGYNHAFILGQKLWIMRKALVLEEPVSQRKLIMYTDAPAVVVYTGGFLGDDGEKQTSFNTKRNCAVAIEPQDVPTYTGRVLNSVDIVRTGELYQRNIQYEFSF